MDPEPRKIETSVENSRGIVIGEGNTQNNYAAPKTLDLGLIGRVARWEAVQELLDMKIGDADRIMEAAPEKDAAHILRLLYSADEGFAVALVAVMHPDRARTLIRLGGPDLSGLKDVPTAAEAISHCHGPKKKSEPRETSLLQRASRSPLGTTGFYRVFTSATIYWSEPTGPVPVHDAFSEFYEKNGGSGGRLGFPLAIGKVATGAAAAKDATRQRFESVPADAAGRASVYRVEGHGVFVTRGGIGEYYERRGGGDRFGFPIGPEIAAGPTRPHGTGDKGWIQPFEKGSITYTDATEALEIMSPIRDHFDALGGVNGRLGFPRGKSHVAGQSPQGTDGRFQRFEGARDYPDDMVAACIGFDRPGGATIYTSTHGTYKVDGGIGIHYERMGGTASWLGFPTGESHKPTEGGPRMDERRRVQDFEGGAIYWSPRHDSIAVRADVLALILPQPDDSFTQIRIGFPTHAEQQIADGPDTVQFFETGVVTRRADALKIWRPEPDGAQAVKR